MAVIRKNRSMIKESGTPREIAERITRLPEGQYRVMLQRVSTRGNVLADFDWTTEEMRHNPAPEAVGKTDDEIQEWANQMVDEARRSFRAKSGVSKIQSRILNIYKITYSNHKR